MEPISNVDHLVLLLRQRIMDASKAKASAKTGPPAPAAPQGEPAGVAALAATEGVSDRQIRRAFVQQMLTDQFGPDLINEAKFHQVVDRVTETIEGDAASAKLMAQVVTELRAAAR